MNKAQIKAAEVLANQRAAFEKKVRSLLGHVAAGVGDRLKKAELDAVFDALQYKGEYGPAADKLAAEIASREPVGKAVHAQKAAAMEHAEQGARAYVERVEAKLREHDMDFEAAYPSPPPGMRSWDARYQMIQQERSNVHRLVDPDQSKGYQSYGRAPYFVVMDPKGIERFVEQSVQEAALQYDAFICKMVAKIGPAKSAELSGSHVWGHSFLDVVKPDGSVERWKTQQIVNYSKYQRPFYQWPSRLMKGGK